MNENTQNEDILKRAINNYGLKQDIARIHKEMMPQLKKQKQPGILKSLLRIAASVLLLIFGAGLYFYFANSSSKLYEEKFATYSPSSVRGNNEKTKENIRFVDGYSLLQAGQPEKAVAVFKSIVADNKAMHDDAEFYLGLAYLKNNDPASAHKVFNNIHQNKQHLYNDEISSWYLLKIKALVLKNKQPAPPRKQQII